MASDIRADIATTGDLHYHQPLYALTANITLPEPPGPQDLTPAIPDAHNMPLFLIEQENFKSNSFVDDNAVCAIHERIIPTPKSTIGICFVWMAY
jgi:hypothetical protein